MDDDHIKTHADEQMKQIDDPGFLIPFLENDLVFNEISEEVPENESFS